MATDALSQKKGEMDQWKLSIEVERKRLQQDEERLLHKKQKIDVEIRKMEEEMRDFEQKRSIMTDKLQESDEFAAAKEAKLEAKLREQLRQLREDYDLERSKILESFKGKRAELREKLDRKKTKLIEELYEDKAETPNDDEELELDDTPQTNLIHVSTQLSPSLNVDNVPADDRTEEEVDAEDFAATQAAEIEVVNNEGGDHGEHSTIDGDEDGATREAVMVESQANDDVIAVEALGKQQKAAPTESDEFEFNGNDARPKVAPRASLERQAKAALTQDGDSQKRPVRSASASNKKSGSTASSTLASAGDSVAKKVPATACVAEVLNKANSTKKSRRRRSREIVPGQLVYPKGFDSRLHARMNCTCLVENWKECRPYRVELDPNCKVIPKIVKLRVAINPEGVGTVQEQDGRRLKVDMDINAASLPPEGQSPVLRDVDISEITVVPDRYDACIFCEVNEDDENAVLCDGCDIAAHIYCLKPPLKSIPNRSWYCKLCQKERRKAPATGTAGKTETAS